MCVTEREGGGRRAAFAGCVVRTREGARRGTIQ